MNPRAAMMYEALGSCGSMVHPCRRLWSCFTAGWTCGPASARSSAGWPRQGYDLPHAVRQRGVAGDVLRDGPRALRDGGHRLRVGADTLASRAACGVGGIEPGEAAA